jgi:hypothetical protein
MRYRADKRRDPFRKRVGNPGGRAEANAHGESKTGAETENKRGKINGTDERQ